MEHLAKLPLPNVGQAMGQLFSLLGLITVMKQTMPPEGHEALGHVRRVVRSLLNPFCFFTVNEIEGSLRNDLYNDIHLHLESCKAYNKANQVTLLRQAKSSSITMRLSNSSDVVVDKYKGMTVWWTHYEEIKDQPLYRRGYGSSSGQKTREFQLRIRKKDKAKLLPEYLEFITKNAATYSGKNRETKIYTNFRDCVGYSQFGSRRLWEEVLYKHPSTFRTLAIDPELKEKIIEDLTSFTGDKEFYERTGRAWKRGYLLYGPPGTGKSSMIAAMSNFLKYDIYDLELSQVRTNGDLRQLLLQTTSRSIIVLEDIDCSVKFTSHRSSGGRSKMVVPDDNFPEDDPNKVTLSGLLNFVDGLWSCCGDERIFVFTTNHVEKLDKALLRPGRMDMQIELSYCTFPAFRVLAQNYLSLQDHPLFEKIEASFVGKTLTPATIAELLIKNKSDVDSALDSVLSAVENNVSESSKAENTATDSEATTQAPCKDKGSGDADSSPKNVTKENLISVLQGVIEALETSTETPSLGTTPSRSDSSVKGFVSSQSSFLKSASEGKLDFAIEAVVQRLATKLSMPEIQQIFNVEDQRNGSSAGAGTGSSLEPKLANGSSSSEGAASNGVLKEIGNGEIKET